MSLVNTLMQPLRAAYKAETADKNEMRASRYGAWNFFQQQTSSSSGVMTTEVKEIIKNSQGNTIQIPVFDAEDVTISNVRSCTVADSENTTQLITLTFVTYSFGFTMIPARFKNNDIKYQQDFDRKLRKYLLKFAATLDSAAVSTLNTNRNQYFPAAITTFYPNVGNALQVTQAQKTDFYNQLQSIHETMDYYEQIHIIGSTTLGAINRQMSAQGQNNAVNLAFQFPQYQFHSTNRITNGAGVNSTLYAVPDGYVATQNRNDIDSMMGSKTGNGKVWDEVQMPIVNLRMGSYYYDDCADKSAMDATTAHLTATRVEGFQWSTDVCFMTAYNSSPSTRYGPILKAEISNT